VTCAFYSVGVTSDGPGPLARARYLCGARLPVRWQEWVRHDLTDPGWRERVVVRSMIQVLPFVVLGAFVPGPAWVHVGVPAVIVLSNLLIVGPFSEELRDARLRQNGLPVPQRRDGPPPPTLWPGMRP
jgi:hypothetical protein